MAKKLNTASLNLLLPVFDMRKILCSLLTVSLSLPSGAFAAESTTPSRDAIDYAMELGVLMPLENGEPSDNKKMTRLEFTLAVTHVLYPTEFEDGCFRDLSPTLPVRYTRLFNDVEKDTWYGKQLCIAMRAGLIRGDHDGNFRPFDFITAGEAAKILSQAYGFTYPSKNPSGLPWYWISMESLRMRGALSQSVQPSDFTTSDMTAQMFYALRNVQRYPASRLIGVKLAPVAALTVDSKKDLQLAAAKEYSSGITVINRDTTTSGPTHSKGDMRIYKKSPRELRRLVKQSRLR